MSLQFESIHPHFGALVHGAVLRDLQDEQVLEGIRRAMGQHALLVFRHQPMTGEEQLAFARRLDGELHTMTTLNVLSDKRSTASALTDISNVGEGGGILDGADRRRMTALGNRLWHTDASFVNPAGRYSMLSAQVVPPVEANTEFADMRAAHDALDEATQAAIRDLQVRHSIVHSRGLLGFEFSEAEQASLPGAVHPLVRSLADSGRRSLYLASHASHVVGMPVADGRLLLADLTEHATQRKFVYTHVWQPGDFVIWDNRATMHRAAAFDDRRYRRELRRTTTLDLPRAQR